MASILKTDNGTHPPEKWAMTTADTIFDLSETSLKEKSLIQAQKVRTAIAEALVSHHSNVQAHEKEKIVKDVNHIVTPYSAEDYFDAAMKDIVAATKGTPWEAHFKNPDVQKAVKEVMGNHFCTVQHIERLWHADRNPACKVSQSYKARFHS